MYIHIMLVPSLWCSGVYTITIAKALLSFLVQYIYLIKCYDKVRYSLQYMGILFLLLVCTFFKIMHPLKRLGLVSWGAVTLYNGPLSGQDTGLS